jgi:hypothetical protein
MKRGSWTRTGVAVGFGALAVGALASVGAAVSPKGKPAAAAQYQPHKVMLCHHTHSKKHPFVTIIVSKNALPAHMRHGDTVGACPAVTAPQQASTKHASKGRSAAHAPKGKAKRAVRAEKSAGTRGRSSTAPGHSGTAPGHAASPAHGGTPPGHGTRPAPGATPPAEVASPPGPSSSSPGHGASPAHGGTPPGHGGTPPGQSGTTPGHGGTPPGHEAPPPGKTKDK